MPTGLQVQSVFRTTIFIGTLAVATGGWFGPSRAQHYPHEAPRHGSGAGTGAAIGAGVGAGIMILDGLIRQEQQRRVESEIADQIAKSKTKGKKPPAKSAKKKGGNEKNAKAPPKQPPVVAKPADPAPGTNLTYTPPVFPQVVLSNCDDCLKLWQSILAYQEIINEDTRKLANRKQELITRRAEIERLKQRASSAAASWDRDHFTRLVSAGEEAVKGLEEGIDFLQKLVDEEWKVLRDRIAQYEACVDRHCPKIPPVAETPKVTPTQPPVVTTPPPIVVAAPPEPGPQSRPDLPPNDNRMICGPDVTFLVLAALRDMKEKFEKAPDKQVEACRSLLDPSTAKGAWDIDALDPSTAVSGDMAYDATTDEWVEQLTDAEKKAGQIPYRKKPWFTTTSNMCAIPRPVCGHTVQFMGTCQHAQVVNYAQWGMMMSLCGGAYPTLGAIAHRIWNRSQYDSNDDNTKAPASQQKLMIAAGSEFNEQLDKDPNKGKDLGFVPDLSEIARRVKEGDRELKHGNQQCELKCELTPEQRRRLERDPFSAKWVNLTIPKPRAGLSEAPAAAREFFDAVTKR